MRLYRINNRCYEPGEFYIIVPAFASNQYSLPQRTSQGTMFSNWISSLQMECIENDDFLLYTWHVGSYLYSCEKIGIKKIFLTGFPMEIERIMTLNIWDSDMSAENKTSPIRYLKYRELLSGSSQFFCFFLMRW